MGGIKDIVDCSSNAEGLMITPWIKVKSLILEPILLVFQADP
jgi:hypothetical protein